MLHIGNCIDFLSRHPEHSFDSIVTDPPYELGFMGKAWDSTGIAYSTELWRQCLRVLKPGGHLLSFGGTRTYHRMACAIEDAGFEIRDQIMWVYGSGFPKSLNISKAIDKAAGAEREIIGESKYSQPAKSGHHGGLTGDNIVFTNERYTPLITASATAEAKQWEGWGTALKPAHEPIVMARKPLIGTVASNVLSHGTGGLNIDGCRVGTESISTHHAPAGTFAGGEIGRGSDTGSYANHQGRWPANFIHDGSEEVLNLFPDLGKSQGGRIGKKSQSAVSVVPAGRYEAGDPGYGDSGSAARFFYCAKASTSERNLGLDDLPDRRQDEDDYERAGTTNPRNRSQKLRRNHHPTVKPLALMRHLVRLVTPRDGTVLDPFLGSGTTAVAAIHEGLGWAGCEANEEYAEIIRARVASATGRA